MLTAEFALSLRRDSGLLNNIDTTFDVESIAICIIVTSLLGTRTESILEVGYRMFLKVPN